jgi:hypothetical protein
MTTRTLAIVLVAVVVRAAPALAHHTVANTHDVSKTVALTGVVTRVSWHNPHVVYHLSVPGEVGVDWEVESRHLEGMRRSGIDQGTIKVGDRVTFNVFLALDGSRHAATDSVVLPGGRTVRIGTVTGRP